LERAKGFEPSTPTLARLCSTPELHPHPAGGDQQRRGKARPPAYAEDGLLQESIAAEQVQELFRVKRARHWPKPCTRTAGQDDGVYHAISSRPKR
jgi:hypothetical protein